MNSLLFNTLQFDKYSRLTIILEKLWFSAKISKTNLKKAFHKLVCRAH